MSGKNISSNNMKEIKVFVPLNQLSIENMFKKYFNLSYCFKILNEKTKEEPDLVVFGSGPDPSPTLYDEIKLKGTVTVPWRDQDDKSLYKRFEHIPKIGINRGALFLNIMSGGQLFQDVDNHKRSHQLVNLLPVGGRWKMGDKIRVSSEHHQMMIPSKDATILGIALDEYETAGIATRYISSKTRSRPTFDTEVVWYEGTESLCFQPSPETFGAEPTRKYFFDLLEFFFLNKIDRKAG